MFGGSKQEQLEHRLDHKLNASSDRYRTLEMCPPK